MTDREMVTALRAGDQLAIGQIYDTYGARVYAYCYDLLADHELAADALRDAFIVANNRARELANPDELGAWLYALTRNEALRHGVSDDIPADAAQGTRGDKFARAALDVYAMLPPESREVLDLAFRHRMVDGDLALVLDMPEDQVANVVTDAQTDLENGLTAVLANRVGDPRCAEIAELGKRFDRLDGKGVDPWLETVARHIDKDKSCADHVANRRPLRLFEELPHAFVPPGVRARVLDTLRDPAGAAFCARIADRAGTFDESGFPSGGRPHNGAGGRKLLPIAGGIGLLVAVVAGVMAFTNNGTKAASTGNTAPQGNTQQATQTTAPAPAATTGPAVAPPTPSDSGAAAPSSSSPTRGTSHTSHSKTPTRTTSSGKTSAPPTTPPTTPPSTPPTTPPTFATLPTPTV